MEKKILEKYYQRTVFQRYRTGNDGHVHIRPS